MRAAVLAAAAALSPVATAAAVAEPPLGLPAPGAASVALSSYRAAARPVAVTVSISAELQCGRLVGRSISLVLPRGERVPRKVPARAVLVGTTPAAAVTVSGRTLEIAPRRPAGAICDSITVGTAKLDVTRAAGLGNPRSPGTYAFVVRHGGGSARATVRIR